MFGAIQSTSNQLAGKVSKSIVRVPKQICCEMLLKSLFVLTLHCSCGLTFKLPDPEAIYITPSPSISEHEALRSGLRTDLVAPAPASHSQYFTHPPRYQGEQNFFHHNAQRNPFLYTGPLMLVMSRHSIPIDDPRNIERNTQSPARDSYDLYRPSIEDNPQFVDMLPPPAQSQEEPDYYAVKPSKKTKKYSAIDEKQKKYKKFENLKAKIVKLTDDDYDEAELNQEANDYPAGSEESSTQSSDESSRTQREAEAEEDVDETSEENQEKSEELEAAEASDTSVETSAPASRLDFHMSGHKGPDTYKFGYDTGHGPNRQFKVEEKDETGAVLGQYGYYDKSGKFRIVKYSASDGFKVL